MTKIKSRKFFTSKQAFNFLPFALFLLILPTDALAYIDPGSAGLALQAFLALIVGGLATFRLWWGKLLSIFKKRKEKK